MALPLRLLAGAVLLTLFGCARDDRPAGVILITIDTCRADRLGAYGDASGATPALDAIAQEGVVFLQAAAPAPITLPSHCSILTGLYPDRHGVRDNGAGRLPEEAVTLAEVLEAQGYRSAGFVAAVPLDAQYGISQGFSHYDDDLAGAAPAPPGGEGDPLSRLHRDQRRADEVMDVALPWIRSALEGRDPFLAWIHFFDPHISYQPPDRVAARFPGDPYRGEIAFVDEQVGRLREALGREWDGILLAVTADHGESLGEHGENTHGFFLYEAAIRVPWILAGPGIPKGVRVSDPVSLVQVMPTLLDALALEPPPDLDGSSALPNARAQTSAGTPVFAEALFPRLHFDWAGTRSVRRGAWKYIDAPRPELYDLAEDPDETRNRIDSEPEIAAELEKMLASHWSRGKALGGSAFLADEASREQLEALGYVGAASTGPVPEEEALWDRKYPDPKDRIELFDPIQDLPQIILGGDPEDARAFVEDLFRRDPGNVAILEMVSRLQARAGQWEDARRTFREMVKAAPDDAATWTRLANAEERLGDTTSALRSYERALALAPASPAAVNGKALLLSHTGRELEAVRVLREGLRQLPDDVETLNNLAWILANARIDPAEAWEHARRAVELAPDDPVFLDTLGWSAIRSGRAAEAIGPLTKAWDATGDAEVRAHLGVALAEAGREAEGRAHVRAAVQERASLAEIPEVARWTE